MSFEKSCPECHFVMGDSDEPVTRKETCPRCGALVLPVAFDLNPYAAPIATADSLVDEFGTTLVVRTSIFQKFAEALHLLFSNLPLIALIVLTIWLPGNILINFIAYNAPEESIQRTMKLTNVVEGLFGPIYTGAMIYALSRRKQGLGVTYSEAMGVGFRRWGSLWWTHVVAGVAILLGLLVLLVPGILFMIRYALIDPIVVLEGEKGGKATTRSSALTVGWKGQICLSAICVFPALMAIGFGVNALAESLGLVPNIVVSIVIDCCLDVISTISAIVLFLIYWEAVHVKGAEARGGVLETPIL